MKKHIEDHIGTCIGFITGALSSPSIFDDWVKPVLVTAICSLVGYMVTIFCKWVHRKIEKL